MYHLPMDRFLKGDLVLHALGACPSFDHLVTQGPGERRPDVARLLFTSWGEAGGGGGGV